MTAFAMLDIAHSGLTMHQTWLDALAYNISNVNTIRPTSGNAFQAQYVVAQNVVGGGVKVAGIELGDGQGRIVNDPSNPLADADGNVRAPDIDMGAQMSDLIMAQRGFQAQVQVAKNAEDVYASALSIGRGA
jgi:flagellar basal-body rod protein FlgC